MRNRLKKMLSCSLSSLIFSTCFSGYRSCADFSFTSNSKLNTDVEAFKVEQNALLSSMPDTKQAAFARVRQIIKNDIDYLGCALKGTAFDYDFSTYDSRYAPNILYKKLLNFYNKCNDEYNSIADAPEDQSNASQWDTLIDAFKAKLDSLNKILTNNSDNTLNEENFKNVTDNLLKESDGKDYNLTLQGYVNYYTPSVGSLLDARSMYTRCTKGAKEFGAWTKAFLSRFREDLTDVLNNIDTIKSKSLVGEKPPDHIPVGGGGNPFPPARDGGRRGETPGPRAPGDSPPPPGEGGKMIKSTIGVVGAATALAVLYLAVLRNGGAELSLPDDWDDGSDMDWNFEDL